MKNLNFTSMLSVIKLKHIGFTSLLAAMLFASSPVKGQAGCCAAINFNDFLNYCIADMDPCIVNTTCNAAALNAAYGITATWLNFRCSTPADCAAGACNVLPVEMVEYDVNYTNDGIELYWTTATEIENEGFEVERSIDGKIWEMLEFIEGQGNALQQNSYSYFDKNPLIGFNYYRIKQVDYNGDHVFSPVKVTIWQGGTNLDQLQLAVLPNPASEWLTVALPQQLDENKDLRFDIYDQAGKLVKTDIIGANETIKVTLDGLAAGYYILNVNQNHVQYSSRFVKK